MAVAVNDIFQVTLRGDLLSQEILSVLHYRVNILGTASTEATFLADLADTLNASGAGCPLVDKYIAAAGNNYTLQAVRAQRVYPARTVYVEAVSGTPGGQAGACLTANNAASIFKRTNTPGRMGVGRLQYGLVPGLKYTGGTIENVYKTGPLLDVASAVIFTFVTTLFTTEMRPCLYNPNAVGPKFSDLFVTGVEDTARTMHRRTLRVGV